MVAFLLATPLAALGFVTAVGLTLLYRFRRHAAKRPIASLLLWRAGCEVNAVERASRRFHFPPLFFLELAVLLLLVGAALTPLFRSSSPALLYVLEDSSASMSARGSDGLTAHDRAARIIAAARRARGEERVVVVPSEEPARRAAEWAKARQAEVLILTDHAPESGLPSGVKQIAVGEPRPNRAVTAASRSTREIRLEVTDFVPGQTDVVSRVHIPCAVTNVPATNIVWRVSPRADDALTEDDEVTLPPPFEASLPVTIQARSPELAACLSRAVQASGYARLVPRNEATVWIGDGAGLAQAPTNAWQMIFQGPQSRTNEWVAVHGPYWTNPDSPFLTGLSFDGLVYADDRAPQSIGTNSVPQVFTVLGETVHTFVETDSRRVKVALDAPHLPFFQSSAFPTLVANFLFEVARHEAGETEDARRPIGLLSASESNLTRACSGEWGVWTSETETAHAVRYGVWLLAALAIILLIIWGFLTRQARIWIILVCLALALARPGWNAWKHGGVLVILADRSLSLNDEARAEEESVVRQILAARPASACAAVVPFAEGALVEARSDSAPFAGFSRTWTGESTDIAAAYEVAATQATEDTPIRCVLLSDGLFTVPPPKGFLPRTDFWSLTRSFNSDLAIVHLAAPNEVAPSAPLSLSAWVWSDHTEVTDWRFYVGTNLLASGRRTFARGLTPLALRDWVPSTAGVRRYRLEITPTPTDARPENNTAQFLVRVAGKRPLAVVDATGGAALAAQFASVGVPAVGCAPHEINFSFAQLGAYAGLILSDLPATEFSSADLRRLAYWVQNTGGALGLAGGESAFGSGGWQSTAVEDILPVTLERRQDKRKYSFALAIVMDRSGSMALSAGSGGRTKMDMANLGARGAIETLNGSDEIAVIAVDSAPHVVLPLQTVSEAFNHLSEVSSIRSEGGGIFIEVGLVAGLRELEKSDAALKHLLLFADANDSENPGAYRDLLTKARESGISVSVIGLGSLVDLDAELLRDIAQVGDGQCYFEDNALEVPRIFMQDTFLATKEMIISNATPLAITAAMRPLSDASFAGAPLIAGGYNLLYARDEAAVAVQTKDEENAPFLAYRQVGLGRTATFAGAFAGPYAAPLMKTRGGAEMAAAFGRYLAGTGDDAVSDFVCDVRLTRGGLRVTAVPTDDEAAIYGEGLAVRVVRERGSTNEVVRMKWISDDQLEAFVPLTSGETVVCVVMHPNGHHQVLPPVCLPYPAEFQPGEDPQAGRRALEKLARQTGGHELLCAEQAWEGLEGRRVRRELAPYLYLLASVLFLGLIALNLRSPRPKSRGKPKPQPESPRAPLVSASTSRYQKAKKRAFGK